LSQSADLTLSTTAPKTNSASYSTTAGDLNPIAREAEAIAQAEDTDADVETEATAPPAPVETRVLGSQARWEIGPIWYSCGATFLA